MLSLAIVSLSPCSAAISSRTGATILQGPHHSAQKSTSTGLSLPSTSLAKLVSVTFTVLPAIGRSPLCRLAVYCPLGKPIERWIYCKDPGPVLRTGSSPLVEGLGEPALGVDRGRRAGAGGGDRLAVDVVDDVTAGEDAVDVGPGRGVVNLDVALVVELQLAGEQLAPGVVADGHEQPADVQDLGGTRVDVGDLDAGNGVLPLHVGDLLAEGPADLLVVLRTLLHDLRGAELVAAVDDGDALGEAGEEGGLLHRGVTPADDHDVLVAEEEAVAGGTGRYPAAEQALLVLQAEVPVLGAGGDDDGVRPVLLAADLDDLGRCAEVDLGDIVGHQLGPESLGLGAHVVHELRTLDALGEAGEVLDVGGGHQRAAELRTLEHQRVEGRPGGEHGPGVPRGAGPDDDQVTHPVVLGRRDRGVRDLTRRDGGTGGRELIHGQHNEDRRTGIPRGPVQRLAASLRAVRRTGLLSQPAA